MYADDNSLTVLYYDSYFAEIFRIQDQTLTPENPESD